MQLGTEPHAAVGHVLHDERIDSRCDDLLRLHAGLFDLIVEKQRIERGIYAHAVLVGILHGTGHVVERVRGGIPRPEFRGADIYGVGTAVDGVDGRSIVTGRSQQFDSLHVVEFSTKIRKLSQINNTEYYLPAAVKHLLHFLYFCRL